MIAGMEDRLRDAEVGSIPRRNLIVDSLSRQGLDVFWVAGRRVTYSFAKNSDSHFDVAMVKIDDGDVCQSFCLISSPASWTSLHRDESDYLRHLEWYALFRTVFSLPSDYEPQFTRFEIKHKVAKSDSTRREMFLVVLRDDATKFLPTLASKKVCESPAEMTTK
jgi:hypothetical protein